MMRRPPAAQSRLADFEPIQRENAVNPATPTLMQLLAIVSDMRSAIQAHEAQLMALQAQVDQLAQQRKR
jgi:hypothetical protein